MKQVQARQRRPRPRRPASRKSCSTELARVQARQRDAVTQTEAAEDQLKRAETMVKQLEQRRTQLAFSEKKIATFEGAARRPDPRDRKRRAEDQGDRRARSAGAGGQGRSRKRPQDQQPQQGRSAVRDRSPRRGHRPARQGRRPARPRRATPTRRSRAIESRRKMVEEVQTRANAITNLLDDINVNLEMLGEQRAVIDHVGEKMARLDFMVQEAQNTLRALQREREVAERIEQGIKSLRASSGGGQDRDSVRIKNTIKKEKSRVPRRCSALVYSLLSFFIACCEPAATGSAAACRSSGSSSAACSSSSTGRWSCRSCAQSPTACRRPHADRSRPRGGTGGFAASVVSASTSATMVSAVFSSSPEEARASSAADGMRGMIKLRARPPRCDVILR